MLIADYGALRSTHARSARGGKTPPNLAAVFASAHVSPDNIARLPSLVPEVGLGYAETFALILAARPADAHSFAVHSLCRFAVEIAGFAAAGEKWLADLMLAFVRAELALVLRNQRLFAKPGQFDWAIFGAPPALDVDVDEQAGDVGEDVYAEGLVADAEAEEAPDNPFTGAELDYDLSEDNPNNSPD
jgi:hypothetical protein